jgi:hypothetical protein
MRGVGKRNKSIFSSKREERITESGEVGTNPEEAAKRARKSGMTKGTAGAGETGSEYEQGSADTNQ